jgi:hypothetical protein
LDDVTVLFLGSLLCIKAYNQSPFARFEAFTVVRIQVEVFGVVTLCSVAVGYQRFGGPCCLHFQVDGSSKVLRNVGIIQQHYKV